MIKLISRFIGMGKFNLIWQLLKKKEFVINMGTLGVMFKRNGEKYVEVSIVAIGHDYGKQVFLTKEQLVKVVKKEVAKKPTVTTHVDSGEVEEEDLF